ncbi:hypothetical protein BC938DRAFT_474719 [Jimgerdemannia flammicorona]|uniref:Uncharacterized protein n=1 Tax=Jimgerdemannia flammicorona TaxID=994334 RepID=A0A433Q1Q6_9FUNG|nr:hypothetical protein BC938DRAFT_474719 [Jimgerdemannia flammicorona]
MLHLLLGGIASAASDPVRFLPHYTIHPVRHGLGVSLSRHVTWLTPEGSRPLTVGGIDMDGADIVEARTTQT